MKLLEVLHVKCNRCGYTFSKGGRDQRAGLCDVCAFPNSDKAKKAKRKMKEGQADPFMAGIEELLWHDYKEDPFLPAGEQYPGEMDDEDYLDFTDHVRDVAKFAQQHRIRNPRKAIDAYNASLAKNPQYQSHGLH